jgi:hypothetical protein
MSTVDLYSVQALCSRVGEWAPSVASVVQ